MSEASLSQDEINALMASDSGELSQLASDFIRVNKLLQTAYGETIGNLIGKNVSISDPKVSSLSKGAVLESLADEVISVDVPFEGDYTGTHLYLMLPEEVPYLAGPMMGQDDVEVNDATLSAVAEAFSQTIASILMTIESEFSTRISGGAPSAERLNKNDLELPENLIKLEYELRLEEQSMKIIEIYDEALAENFGKLLSVNSAATPSNPTNSQNVQSVKFPEFAVSNMSDQEEQNLGLLMDIPMVVTVELGRTKWQLRDVLTMGEGSIIELDKQAGEPVDVLVNNNLIARGEVVVVDENFSVRITEIISNIEQMLQKAD